MYELRFNDQRERYEVYWIRALVLNDILVALLTHSTQNSAYAHAVHTSVIKLWLCYVKGSVCTIKNSINITYKNLKRIIM